MEQQHHQPPNRDATLQRNACESGVHVSASTRNILYAPRRNGPFFGTNKC
jgi:hypothetical protein